MAPLLESYIALILVIILWVAVWAIADVFGKMYLKTHNDRLRFYASAAAVVSFILVVYFPKHVTI